jgi:hypothetical protein
MANQAGLPLTPTAGFSPTRRAWLPLNAGCRHAQTSYVVDLDAFRRKKKEQRRKRPKVVRLLRKAQEYQWLLDSGQAPSQAFLARRDGLTRPRVTQLLNLLKLAPEILEAVLGLPVGTPELLVTERKLRVLAALEDHQAQLAAFQQMVGDKVTITWSAMPDGSGSDIMPAPCAGAPGCDAGGQSAGR